MKVLCKEALIFQFPIAQPEASSARVRNPASPTSRAAQDADDSASRQELEWQPDELAEQSLTGNLRTIHLGILVADQAYVKSGNRSVK